MVRADSLNKTEIGYAFKAQNKLKIAPNLPNKVSADVLDSYTKQAQSVISEAEREMGVKVADYLKNHVQEQIGVLAHMVEKEGKIDSLESKVGDLNAELGIDPLTQIPNYKALRGKLDREVERVQRGYWRTNNAEEAKKVLPTSVIMIDADDFKKYNDSYGHQAGNDALKKIAEIMKKEVRKIDLVGRYGGEEFVAVLTEANKEQAYNVAERIRESAENSGLKYPISLCLGIADTSDVTFGENTVDELIEKADKAMYHSKNSGKNQTTIYNGRIDE